MPRNPDPYAVAQFSSLWQVVVHAAREGEDRSVLYRDAHEAMVADHQWREYRMLFSPIKGYHVGYRYARPTDWFTKDGELIDGPFRSKKLILHKLRVKTSKKVSPGVYSVEGTTLFLRSEATALGVDPNALP